MLDVFHIPSNTDNTKIFYASGGTTSWQTWQKPRNAKFIQIFCLGGGAGGGGAAGNVTASSAGGGGGGGGAAFSREIIPVFLLPDTLYVQVGVGGTGGAGSAGAGNGFAGIAGGISYISLAPTASIPSVIMQSATTTGAGAGASGNVAAAGAAGAAGTVWTITNNAFASIGLVLASAGIIGTTGGFTAAPPTGPIALASNIITGGAGGAGKNTNTTQFDGATLAQASVILTSPVSGGIAPGGAGNNGYGSLIPFCSIGGAGGASSLTTKGGRGGDGWYGSGGGGGGGGLSTAGGGGNGGKGGDGLVIITTIF
jgi:hypothetical protein